jgi:hypothetical protein
MKLIMLFIKCIKALKLHGLAIILPLLSVVVTIVPLLLLQGTKGAFCAKETAGIISTDKIATNNKDIIIFFIDLNLIIKDSFLN